MAFKMAGPPYKSALKHEEMRQDIREERKSLKDEGGTRKDVKEFNKYQRKRKKEIREETKASAMKNYKKGYYGA